MSNNYIFITSRNNPSFDFLPLNNIKVFYLEAPLSGVKDYNSTLLQFNLYHTGFGFECGNIRFGIEFTSNSTILDSIIPKILNKNGVDELIWTNDCSVRFIDLNIDYWTKSNYICTITKDHFLSFRNDILDNYIPNNLYYVLFNVCEDSSKEYLNNPTLRSSTSDNFINYGMNFFKKLGVNIEYITYSKLTSVSLIGSVKKLNYNKNKDKIIKFYTTINNLINKIKENTLDIKEIISLFIYYLQNLNTIIYYGYDIYNNDKDQMSYYSIQLSGLPVIKYEKNNVVNSYSYTSFINLLEYKSSSNFSPKTISNFFNNKNHKTLNILIISAIIVIILIIYLFFKIYSKKSDSVYKSTYKPSILQLTKK